VFVELVHEIYHLYQCSNIILIYIYIYIKYFFRKIKQNVDITIEKANYYQSNSEFNIAPKIITSNFVSLEMQFWKIIIACHGVLK